MRLVHNQLKVNSHNEIQNRYINVYINVFIVKISCVVMILKARNSNCVSWSDRMSEKVDQKKLSLGTRTTDLHLSRRGTLGSMQ